MQHLPQPHSAFKKRERRRIVFAVMQGARRIITAAVTIVLFTALAAIIYQRVHSFVPASILQGQTTQCSYDACNTSWNTASKCPVGQSCISNSQLFCGSFTCC